MEDEFFDEEAKEEDFYDDETLEELEEDDEISLEEEAFMKGYQEAEKEEDE